MRVQHRGWDYGGKVPWRFIPPESLVTINRWS